MTVINFRLRFNVSVAFDIPPDAPPELVEVLQTIYFSPQHTGLLAPSVNEEVAGYLQKTIKNAPPFREMLEQDAANFTLTPAAGQWLKQQIAADGPGLDALMGAMAITVQGLEMRVKNSHAPQPIGPSWWLRLRKLLRI